MLEQLKDLDNTIFIALNGSNSLYWDGVMWLVSKTATWIPLLLVLLYVVVKNDGPRRLFFVAIAMILTVTLADRLSSGLIKPMVMRWRPTHDATFLSTIDVVFGYLGGRYGFVSSHAANTFSLFLFLSLLFRSRLMTVCLFFWACITSYSRVYLGVHFPGDILCGALLGVVVGWVVYLAYKYVCSRVMTEQQFYSSAYTSSGFLHTDMQLLALALVLTYAAVFIVAIPLAVR